MRSLKTDGINLALHGKVQTFIDNVIIESEQDITRLWHTPVRKQEKPLITEDKAWENLCFLCLLGP